MRTLEQLILIIVVALQSGCGPQPPSSITDPRLAPMLKAIAAADRAPLGFTPIPTNARVQLEDGGRATYDAMLHIYAETSRTVAFRKTSDGYKWIAEQEEFFGPKNYTTIDGTFQEHLYIEYQTEHINGIPTNQVCVDYYGNDFRLAKRDHLTLEDVKPVLAEWKGTPIR
jgi:hypothetical protein